jgi:hypothetical protein
VQDFSLRLVALRSADGTDLHPRPVGPAGKSIQEEDVPHPWTTKESIMRSLLALSLVLVLPLLLLAQDDKKPQPKPNTLTEKEARDGWLLLFDGETPLGWKVDGVVKVDKGVLVLGGEKRTVVTLPLSYFDLHWEHRMEGANPPLRVCLASRGEKSVASLKSQLPRSTSAGEGQWLVEHWTNRTQPTGSGGAQRGKVDPNTGLSILETITYFPHDCHVSVSLDVPAGSKLFLRNVKLRPSALKPVFNGKDLTGWKKYTDNPKRAKSNFTVTREGWLNVKDGPGDLQTEKLFDDFVLQLECISNGKHLNSGIFFRCIPGQYQNGYEAQVRNQFTDRPTQKYKVEEYDPKTHKLVGTKTILSTAVDYGTGAIYRRVPARKAVARDGEWFTLTVVGRGRHIATWVNGIQQVDWTDNRPDSDNPRNGYRAAAGAISIQGHDPTTDLSFRNIRIAELPREKK